MTPTEAIARLREIEREGTKGPWSEVPRDADWCLSDQDARLIAAARNLLPVLLDVLEKADEFGNEYTEDSCRAALAAIEREVEGKP